MSLSLITGAAQTAAMAAMKSPATRSLVRRAMHKLWKWMRLKRLNCVVVNDYHRMMLQQQVTLNDKFHILDIEAVYLSMLSDLDVATLRSLKTTNSRSWIISVRNQFKAILNAMRWTYMDKHIIVVLSNRELAKQIHIKASNTFTFEADDELHSDVLEKLDVKLKSYYMHLRQMNKGSITHEYGSVMQLGRIVERQFL